MKARIPPIKRLNKHEKLKLAEVADKYVRARQGRIVHRVMKGFCYVLNREFGFGHDRLERLIDEVENLVNEHEVDELFWEHLDKVIIDELRLDDRFISEKIDLEGNFIDV